MAKDLNLDLLKQGLPGIHAELPVDPFIRTTRFDAQISTLIPEFNPEVPNDNSVAIP